MTERIECAVIGAGVVGLAVARTMAMAGREVIILEAADAIGTGASSRNSEVIHAGIYYPAGSVKALTCVEGKHRLYEYCESHGVAHRKCQKLIVATDSDQLDTLEGIRRNAAENGVTDLTWIERPALREMEPALRAAAALLSPSTGIIDSHGLMLAYQGDAEDAGAVIAFNTPVTGGTAAAGGALRLETGGEQPMTLACGMVVNCGGLHAPHIAARIDGLPAEHVPTAYYAKGNYFTLGGKAPFSRLIYPVPEQAGLGVHLTLDMGGQARFGPDVEWIDEIDYEVDPRRGDVFYEAVRKYWPELEDGALQPGYSGIRPKIQAPGEPARDFVISGPEDHGVAGLVNMFGIESPGLTASLALADAVAGRLADQ